MSQPTNFIWVIFLVINSNVIILPLVRLATMFLKHGSSIFWTFSTSGPSYLLSFATTICMAVFSPHLGLSFREAFTNQPHTHNNTHISFSKSIPCLFFPLYNLMSSDDIHVCLPSTPNSECKFNKRGSKSVHWFFSWYLKQCWEHSRKELLDGWMHY